MIQTLKILKREDKLGLGRPVFLALALALLLPSVGFSAPKLKPKPGPSPEAQVLWDLWYTVTIGGKTPVSYYNDRAEIKKGRYYIQNSVWKKEEGFINEEQLGEFSEADAELTPLFFNFRSIYRSTETIIDGTLKEDHRLHVLVKKNGSELPLLKRHIPNKTFLSGTFSIWLGRHLSQLKVGNTVSFSTVLEDQVDAGFGPINGTVRLEKDDDYSKSTQTKKVTVDYSGRRTTWWVDQNGAAVRISMPQQRTLVQRVTRAEAEKSLDHPEKSAKSKE